MKVTTKPVAERSVTLEATMDELQTLYDGTRKGRRNRAQERALEEFGNAMLEAVPELLQEESDAGTEQ